LPVRFAPTGRGLAEKVVGAQERFSGNLRPRLEAGVGGEALAVSFTQNGCGSWTMGTGMPLHNIPFAMSFGALDPAP